jgi:hypothetical protein
MGKILIRDLREPLVKMWLVQLTKTSQYICCKR